LTAASLLCTPLLERRLGDRIRELGARPVAPGGGGFDTAYLSNDVWGRGYPGFIAACLDGDGLRWLHTSSAGTDRPEFGRLLDRGVRITTASGAAADSIAGSVLMYLLAMSRRLPDRLRDQTAHRWAPGFYRDLAGCTVGILGMGPIGRRTATLLEAHGMRPIGLRRTPAGDEPCETWPVARLAELAGFADALVLAAPLTGQTQGIVDRAVLAALGPDGFLVNVARGGLVDEPALIELLRTGGLGGAALDVTANEPLPGDSPLWDLPGVIITSHSSGLSDLTVARTDEQFLDNLRRWTAGAPLRNEVTRA
jgi:phosphoglycerate dehydrogenase-like enzyme